MALFKNPDLLIESGMKLMIPKTLHKFKYIFSACGATKRQEQHRSAIACLWKPETPASKQRHMLASCIQKDPWTSYGDNASDIDDAQLVNLLTTKAVWEPILICGQKYTLYTLMYQLRTGAHNSDTPFENLRVP